MFFFSPLDVELNFFGYVPVEQILLGLRYNVWVDDRDVVDGIQMIT